MISDGLVWHITPHPGGAGKVLAIVTMAFSLGDGLNDAFNPRQ